MTFNGEKWHFKGRQGVPEEEKVSEGKNCFSRGKKSVREKMR